MIKKSHHCTADRGLTQSRASPLAKIHTGILFTATFHFHKTSVGSSHLDREEIGDFTLKAIWMCLNESYYEAEMFSSAPSVANCLFCTSVWFRYQAVLRDFGSIPGATTCRSQTPKSLGRGGQTPWDKVLGTHSPSTYCSVPPCSSLHQCSHPTAIEAVRFLPP